MKLKLGRVCVESLSISTVTDDYNGSFIQEYLVNLNDKKMVKFYKKFAEQEAWDQAVSIAFGEGEEYGCSSYPDNRSKVWATSNKHNSKLKFNKKALDKSYKFMQKILDEDQEFGGGDYEDFI